VVVRAEPAGTGEGGDAVQRAPGNLGEGVRVTAAGQEETLEAWREGPHDDLVLAVALAAWWGEKALPGHVYVAPSDRHLLLQPNGRLALCDAAPVDWWRPAVDRLFESAAASLGPRAIGVVLSGSLYDGMRGTAAIRRAGGLTIAQSEKSCDHFEMPAAAIDWGGADIVLPPAKIAEALIVAARLGQPEAA